MNRTYLLSIFISMAFIGHGQTLREDWNILLSEKIYESIPLSMEEMQKRSQKWFENNFITFKDTRDLTLIPGENQIKARFIATHKIQWNPQEFYSFIVIQFKENRARIRFLLTDDMEGKKAAKIFYDNKRSLKYYEKDLKNIVHTTTIMAFDFEQYLKGYFDMDDDDW